MSKPKAKATGRPLALTDHIHKEVIKGIDAGLRPREAILRLGFSETTATNWLANGNRGIEPFLAFVTDIKKHEGKLEMDCSNEALVSARAMAKGGFNSKGNYVSGNAVMLITWLSRRFPERWAETQKLQLDLSPMMAKLEDLKNELRKGRTEPDAGDVPDDVPDAEYKVIV